MSKKETKLSKLEEFFDTFEDVKADVKVNKDILNQCEKFGFSPDEETDFQYIVEFFMDMYTLEWADPVTDIKKGKKVSKKAPKPGKKKQK